MEPYIKIENLIKTYYKDNKDVFKLEVKELSLPQQGLVFIRGKSGAGKTTLLNIIGLLDAPTAGTIAIGGRNTSALSSKEKTASRREIFGYIFQSSNLIPTLTVRENVLLPLFPLGRTAREKANKINGLLERVGLKERQRHLPLELSGGEQQRAAIARALVNEPRVILADEPTANLDPENARAILAILFEMAQNEKKLVIISGSDIPVPTAIAPREIILNEGRLAPRT